MQEFSQRKRGGLHIGKEEAQSSSFPNVDCSHEKLVEPTDKTIRIRRNFKKFPITKQAFRNLKLSI